MVKVVMHPIFMLVFLVFEVLMGAETAAIFPKTQNELASENVNAKTLQSDPKTLTNKSQTENVAKIPLEASLLAAMASEDIKQDKPGASEVDPKSAKSSFLPVARESLPSLGTDHFVEKVSIPPFHAEKGVNSNEKKMEEDVKTKGLAGFWPFFVPSKSEVTTGQHSTTESEVTTGQHSTTELEVSTGQHSTTESEVTTGQHSTTESEIEATKTMTSKNTKASAEAITEKIPAEGKGYLFQIKGKVIASKIASKPRNETSMEGKHLQEACQKDRKIVKLESSQPNSAFRNINNPLAYFILNLVIVVMLL